MQTNRGSIIGASLWMILVGGLLLWVPFLGPFLGGIVGGRHAGSVGRALLSVLCAVALVGGAGWLLGTAVTSWPLVAAIAGLGASALVVAHAGPLVLGGIIGGLTSRRQR